MALGIIKGFKVGNIDSESRFRLHAFLVNARRCYQFGQSSSRA